MTSIVDPARRRRLPPTTNRFADSSDDESENEEERRLQQEEEEQERILSEQHGEAEEVATKKRSSTEDIEAEYASSSRKRVKRPTLTPAILTGSSGLIKLRQELPRSVKWPSHHPNKQQAATSYSRNLISSYKTWTYDLFPSMAFEDVLTRIESFGSKPEVKTYLTNMREEVRNGHVEAIYGKQKAQEMIQELEDGLQQEQQQEETMEYETTRVGEGVESEATTRGPQDEMTPPTTTTEAPTNPTPPPVESRVHQTATTMDDGGDLQDTDEEEELEIAPRPSTAPTKHSSVNLFESDDDDDESEKQDESGGTTREPKVAENENASASSTGQENNDKLHGAPPPVDTNLLTSPSKEETSMAVASQPTMETQAPDVVMHPSLEDSEAIVEKIPTTMETQSPDSGSNKMESLTPIPQQEPTSTAEETSPEKTQPESPNKEVEPVFEDPSQENLSADDETATIIATMETQLESPEMSESNTETETQVEETATIVASTASTLETQSLETNDSQVNESLPTDADNDNEEPKETEESVVTETNKVMGDM